MKTTRNAIAVGFVTVVIMTGLYFALKFVSESAETEGEYRVWAIFPDATGLVKRSEIKIAGISIGNIESIRLQEYEAKIEDMDAGVKKEVRVGARVDFIVHGDVALYEDAVAMRSASGLLGNQFVVFMPGDSSKRQLKDGDQVKKIGDEGLLGHLDEITGDIREVTKNLKSVFGSEEGGQHMAEVLANLRDISVSINELLNKNTENVNRTLENIDGIASDARPGVREILADIKQITSEVRVFVEDSRGKAGSAVSEADQAMKDIRGTVAKLDQTLENLADVTEGLKEGEGTVGRLLKDDKLIDDVEEVVEGAGDFVKGLTKLKTIVGLAGEFGFYDNTVKTTLQLRLQPREDKYYLIEAIYDPRGATSRTERVIESTNPNDPPQYKEVVYKTEDELLFSFMFARRLRFATFRFGIKESSGGLGMDIHLLRDRIEFVTDLYRFGDDVYPRLKELVAIEFLRHLYIIGGVNDIINDERDYFIGMMLRFNDEDLKTMMPFTPSP
ncbi:MAG: MCE family protein [Deltaproteobacteria bacterium]|nr:MCE family protein [Deltaproteobacteria bacterium]